MVVPMKKVSLVVMDKHREDSLKTLRETGVIHLERKAVSSDALSKLLDRKTRIENALGILRSQEAVLKSAKKSSPAEAQAGISSRRKRASDFVNSEGVPFSTEALNAPDRKDLALHVAELGEEKKFLLERRIILSKEQGRIEGWGSFNPDDLDFLKKKGVVFTLYEFTQKVFESLPADIPYIVTGTDKNVVRVVVMDKEVPGEAPFALGEHSLKSIGSLLADIHDQIADIDRQLNSLIARRFVIENEMKALLKEIEFETASAGMAVLEDVPEKNAVSWITGFVPAEELGILKRAAAENCWALLAEDPGPDDTVPTKLKNNRLVSLLNPLTEFLEVMPGYHEADISGWFLLFFVIFFGMIFGDAGYGAIIIVAALAGILKTLKKGVPAIFKLLLLLGASNFLWGMLTCSWFGIPSESLPEALKNLSFGPISSVNPDGGFVQQNLMLICFTLAVLQLSIGHIVAITRLRTLKILGELGSIAMLVGMYGVVLLLIAKIDFGQMMPCTYALGAGFVINFVFTNYEGSVGRSILESVKNIISMILGIANVFSDIMSYIRLWAVGLAGGAIASTVVTMAGPMLGKLYLFIFGIILLVFGHGLNLVLNVLSVLVHGVRLNTLEFSGHAGLTWAGTPYKPFQEGSKQ